MPKLLPATPESLAEASRILGEGGLVAFPTETVYGLGADATNDAAVARIFEAKGRPSFNPLIIHVSDLGAAKGLAEFDDRALLLAERFWPGPLTLVLPRRADSPVSLLATAGLDSVAVRIPAHSVALELLKAFRHPIAAPSANPSGRLSPTRAEHVADGLGKAVNLVLDGGPCRVGVESTVLSLTGEKPCLLRPGGVSLEMLEKMLGRVERATEGGPVQSPGQLESHYAPYARVRLNALKAVPGELLLGFGPTAPSDCLNLSPSGDLVEAASHLFAFLRKLDRPDVAGIAVMPIPDHGLGLAINDRLRRAAAGNAES
ncbi:MAG: threonylcarbamoyl-AMP synthase [Alphaproteobacteria bacterium]|nr:threonylcarbamoyl-AMP synthase [Alphaproteobacteria bacterium]